MKTRGNLFIGIVLLVCASSVAGDTHYVASGQSIQAAIDAAESGAVIEVAPGTYTGPGRTDTVPALVDFKGKALRLRSSGGPTATTIDGTGYYHVVQCVNGEATDTVLEGFTVTGGEALGAGQDGRGGGMYNWHASPTVTNCIFRENKGGHGGGIFNYGSGPTVTDSTFRNNEAGLGGGICSVMSSPVVIGCTFLDNRADEGGGMHNGDGPGTVTNCTFHHNVAEDGGGMDNQLSNPVVTNCLFTANAADTGGGMRSLISDPIVTNCTFSGNTAGISGGGMNSTGVGHTLTVTNCVLWRNASTQIGGDPATLVVTYSDVQGAWTGEDNIDADPLFVDASGGDYHLAPGSPCIDAGTNSPAGGLPSTDIEGNPRPVDGNGDGIAAADMGACEAPRVTLQQLVRDVLQKVLDLNLEPQVRASLMAELNAALRLAGDGNARNNAGVVGALNGFIRTVTAYRGKKIAEADADALIAAAQRIVNLLSRG